MVGQVQTERLRGQAVVVEQRSRTQLRQAYRIATGSGTSGVASVIVPMLRLLIGMPNSVAL